MPIAIMTADAEKDGDWLEAAIRKEEGLHTVQLGGFSTLDEAEVAQRWRCAHHNYITPKINEDSSFFLS